MILETRIFFVFFAAVYMNEISNTFDSRCPLECICLTHRQVICNSGNLQDIIYTLPLTVEELSLTKSSIPLIKTESFVGLKSLHKLILDGNNLTRIQQFAFKGLGKLQELSIQHTSLNKLEKFTFAGLQNVTAIMLAYNKISFIEAFTFTGTSHIRLILLTHNPLHTVYMNAFSGLSNVEHLIFPSGIKVIEPDAFNGLDSVGLVKLAFMDLSTLEPFTFRGLSHVHVLAIQESDLGIMKDRVFEGLDYVGTLNVVNNKIDHIEELKITYENHVKIFRLLGNHMLKMPELNFVEVKVLENFTVVGNHFPCDCRIRLLTTSALANGTSYNFSMKNYCISPLEMNGKPINEMKTENSKCASYYNSDTWNTAAIQCELNVNNLLGIIFFIYCIVFPFFTFYLV